MRWRAIGRSVLPRAWVDSFWLIYTEVVIMAVLFACLIAYTG